MRYNSLIVLILLLFSCKKEEVKIEKIDTSLLTNGALVLCEGLFQQNNSSLSWINFQNSSVVNNVFLNQTSRVLGDTGNDMVEYGGKVYIVINVSSTIEVLDKKTLTSLQQIDMKINGVAKSPRKIKFYNGLGYVTCYDGYVDVIDTTSLSIINRIKVGDNPEDLCFANSKMYVSNSGGLNVPNVDSTISVIDLVDFEEIKKITVGKNPGGVLTDSDGDVYVITRGNYGSIPSRMVKVNSISDEIEEVFSFNASSLTKMEDDFIITYNDYNTQESSIMLFDPSEDIVISDDFISTSHFSTLYGIYFNEKNQKIYAFDAMNYLNSGYVKVFNTSGNFEKSYPVGLNPNSILFYE